MYDNVSIWKLLARDAEARALFYATNDEISMWSALTPEEQDEYLEKAEEDLLKRYTEMVGSS